MKVKFTTTLDDELLERIKILAIRQKCSVAVIIEKCMIDYLEKAGA